MERYIIADTYADGWIEQSVEVCRDVFFSKLQNAIINFQAMPAEWCLAWFYIPNPQNEPYGLAFIIEEPIF